MLNTQNPLYIGMQGCCDEKPGYFKGRIDDVSHTCLVNKTLNKPSHSAMRHIEIEQVAPSLALGIVLVRCVVDEHSRFECKSHLSKRLFYY